MHPEVFCNLGVAYQKNLQFERAINNFYQALNLKEDYPEAHNNLGIILNDIGNLEEAYLSLKKADKINNKMNVKDAEINILLYL